MTRTASSPRPQFSGPTHIPYRSTVRYVWGDEISGLVTDWIYVSSEKIHQLVFGLPPGGSFRHSHDFRTVFAADEVFYVLQGTLVLANPEIGEVRRAERGEAIFFRRDTWHHAFSYGRHALRVLELFAPPPAQGTSGAYAKTRPDLESIRYVQDEWLGRWPQAEAQEAEHSTMRVIRQEDLLWRLEDRESEVLTGLLVSTEHLTVGKIELQPGQSTSVETHGGDESLYVLDGDLQVRLPEDQEIWFELKPQDGFYVPEGVQHQYRNLSDRVATLIFATAPAYLPS